MTSSNLWWRKRGKSTTQFYQVRLTTAPRLIGLHVCSCSVSRDTKAGDGWHKNSFKQHRISLSSPVAAVADPWKNAVDRDIICLPSF